MPAQTGTAVTGTAVTGTAVTETTDADDFAVESDDYESDDYGLTDASLIGESQYEIVDSERPGKVKLNLLASLAGVVNDNSRYFTTEFYQAMLPKANAYVDAMERYGEEPHPPFDPDRRQFVTSLQNKVWDQGRWYVDAGNLCASIYLDPSIPREAAVIARARGKQKVGCSVRWHAARAPKSGKTKSGQAVQLFDAEVGEKVFAAVLDYVPNPAFTQAGRVMTDATLLLPMTDASQAVPEPLVDDDGGAVISNETISVPVTASLPTGKKAILPLKEKRPVTATELRAQAATMEESPAKAALLDAADQLETAQTAPTLDSILTKVREEFAPQISQASQFITDTQKAEAQKAEAQKVTALADAVETGAAAEVARFTDEGVRSKFARRIRQSATEAEARTALTDAIEHQDEIASAVELSMKGFRGAVDAGGDGGGGAAQGRTTPASSDRVEVVMDDKDKRTDAFLDSVNRSTEKHLASYGVTPDPSLYKATKGKVDALLGSTEQRVGRQAIVDAVDFLTTPAGKKNRDAGMGALRAMTDAGLLDDSPITDAVLGTTNILQQPVLLPLVNRPLYQNLTVLKYMGAFGPNAEFRAGVSAGFDGGGGAKDLGRIFKFQSRYFQRPVHSTQGRTRNSGRVYENQGIPRSVLSNSWQSFNTYRRAYAFALTKEVVNWTATGSAPFDLLGDTMAQNIALTSRETDNLGYYEMVSVTLEQNCATLQNPETVAAGNITNGNVQDGVAYGVGGGSNALDFAPDNPYPPQGVAAIVQPDCGGPVQKTPAAAGRIPDNNANASVSNACRTPLVPPRDVVTVDFNNNETTTTRFPIIVKKGAATLVPGYLTEENEIGSFYDPATGTITQANYAVDFVRGKIVFAPSAGVTNATANLTIQYSYATNFAQIQVNFGSMGYPGGVTSRAYYDTIFIQNNITAAKMGSHPNYSRPDYCLGSEIAASYIVQSDIFDKLKSPVGTELINPTAQTYAEYNGVMYEQFNAPSILGNDALLLIRNEMSKYVVETPLHTEGGFASYDGSNQLVASQQFMMNQFETFCTPLAQDRSGIVFNQPSRLVVLF